MRKGSISMVCFVLQRLLVMMVVLDFVLVKADGGGVKVR